jgi:hypothetical protein
MLAVTQTESLHSTHAPTPPLIASFFPNHTPHIDVITGLQKQSFPSYRVEYYSIYFAFTVFIEEISLVTVP